MQPASIRQIRPFASSAKCAVATDTQLPEQHAAFPDGLLVTGEGVEVLRVQLTSLLVPTRGRRSLVAALRDGYCFATGNTPRRHG